MLRTATGDRPTMGYCILYAGHEPKLASSVPFSSMPVLLCAFFYGATATLLMCAAFGKAFGDSRLCGEQGGAPCTNSLRSGRQITYRSRKLNVLTPALTMLVNLQPRQARDRALVAARTLWLCSVFVAAWCPRRINQTCLPANLSVLRPQRRHDDSVILLNRLVQFTACHPFEFEQIGILARGHAWCPNRAAVLFYPCLYLTFFFSFSKRHPLEHISIPVVERHRSIRGSAWMGMEW